MPNSRWIRRSRSLPTLLALIALGAAPMTADTPFTAAPITDTITDLAEIPRPSNKRDVPTGRLLVPYYEVDVNGASGTTTLFAVRNESLTTVEIDIRYFEADAPQAAQRTDRVSLGAKGVHTVNLSFVQQLEVDPDGFARGYVIIDQIGDGAGVLHGDTFQIDPSNDFATGTLLLDIDPDSFENDLCSTVSIRFLQGGGFDGGTVYRFWIETGAVPLPEGSLAYSIYNEAGNLVSGGSLTPIEAAFELPASQLLVGPASGTAFGAIEFQLSGVVGHVSSTMSALSRYSVGLEATCID